jgi:Tol biopolymer transport system component
MTPFRFAAFCLALLSLSLLRPVPAADDEKATEPMPLACNTDASEDEPHVSSDLRTLYYSSNARGNWDVYVSTRATNRGPWGRGQMLEDYLNSKDDEKSVFATPEGRYPQYLFACAKKTRDVSRPNWDIFVSTRLGPRAAFTAPTPLNTVDTEANEMHPWLSADGRRLYFSRRDADGWRVYAASRQSATGGAGFGRPVLLKDLPVGFHHPTLTPDERTLYLQGQLADDRWGLFVSTLTSNKWSEPQALSVNSPEAVSGDMSPCLSRDGSLLYFSSDRPGGKGKRDLYVVQTALLKRGAPK